MMIHEEGSILIERPIDVVFDFLLDGMNNALWRTSVTDVQKVPGKPNTYKMGMKGPGGRVDGDYEITEIRPHELIVMKGIAGMVRPTATFALQASGDATRVTFSLHFEGKGPAKMMEPLAAPTMRNEVGMLPNLKAGLETKRSAEGEGYEDHQSE
jgi:carbon monoxide dehydrogenase subunit G